jgi:hypothetical protein
MASREKLVAALKNVKSKKDWQVVAQDLKKQSIDVLYRKGNADEAILEDQLKMFVKNIKVGETSQLTFLKGKPYIVRVIEEKQQSAKPLQEVSAEIRKALVPIQMKKAIKQISEELMKTATVEYADKNGK